MLVTRDQTGRVVNTGDTVTDFRGNTRVFNGATRPRGPGHTGKVLLDGCECYDTVANLTVTEEG